MELDDVLKTVMSLGIEDRRKVLSALLTDPELEINPLDPFGLRSSAEAAQVLQEVLLAHEAARQQEFE